MSQPDRRTVLRALAIGGLLAATGCGRDAETAQQAVRPPAPTLPTTLSTPGPTTGPAAFLRTGDRAGRQVAITFHGGGERRLTEAALEHLEQAGAPATIFAIGTWLEDEPTLARRILDGGHELGNHTYTHPDTATLSRGQLASEIARCRDVLVRQTGSPGLAIRAPETDVPVSKVQLAAADAGYRYVSGFDVDPQDYDDPGPDLIVRRVLAQARGGSVVFLHLGHQGTTDALPAVLAGLRQRGLAPVTVTHLLKL